MVTSKGKKSKNKQVGLHQIKKILHNERYHPQNEKQSMECKKIFVSHISNKDLVCKIK